MPAGPPRPDGLPRALTPAAPARRQRSSVAPSLSLSVPLKHRRDTEAGDGEGDAPMDSRTSSDVTPGPHRRLWVLHPVPCIQPLTSKENNSGNQRNSCFGPSAPGVPGTVPRHTQAPAAFILIERCPRAHGHPTQKGKVDNPVLRGRVRALISVTREATLSPRDPGHPTVSGLTSHTNLVWRNCPSPHTHLLPTGQRTGRVLWASSPLGTPAPSAGSPAGHPRRVPMRQRTTPLCRYTNHGPLNPTLQLEKHPRPKRTTSNTTARKEVTGTATGRQGH